jgi:hypothetical protein
MAPPKTHTKVVSSLKGKSVDIIEFGKDLYNEKSVVLMPGKGCGTDVDTVSDYDNMMKLALGEGFAALAAIFKQFVFDSRKRLILTGHTDTGGDKALNFDLGVKRAEAIYCLLTGKKDRWAMLAREKHGIRDYKWIMAYFNYLGGDDFKDDTGCNPWKINDEWDDKTEAAVKGFFKGVKKHFKLGIDDADLAKKVKEDANKLWPEVIWKSVFDLYIEKMQKLLNVDAAGLKELRDKKLKFAQAGREFLGCGASFPMKTPADSKYQKEKYRRVDALFFYQSDVPSRKKGVPKIVCIPVTDKLHEEKQCPIYHDKHFIANYLNPLEELALIAYHLKFDFYNAVQLANDIPKVRQVPEGLIIQAFYYKKVGAKTTKEPIAAITKFNKGIYTVKVVDDPARKNIHFEFRSVIKMAPKLERCWVHTKDQNSEPKLVAKTDEDILKLMTPDKFKDRLCYYDLPYEWSSENYITRYKVGAAWKGGRFHDVLKAELKLRPYDKKDSDVNNPLIFSLDDIVFVGADEKQDLGDKDKNDAVKDLSADSRLALLHVVKHDLKLYKPRKDSTDNLPAEESACFSQIDFRKEKSGPNDIWRNVITDVPAGTRGIMFCNNFYGVFDKRAGQKAGTWDPAKMHIKGCRAARLKDPDSHFPDKYMYKSYDTGKITMANGSDQVTGTGTLFSANIKPDYKIVPYNKATSKSTRTRFYVKSVQSNTRLTLATNATNAEADIFYDAIPHCRYSAETVGNYELFYIHYGCIKRGGDFPGGFKVRSFLIIYWNGRFQSVGTTATDVERYEKIGLRNAKARWEKKEFALEPANLDGQQKGKIQIKLVFFFEAKTADRGGKHKCTVSITNNAGDGSMGVDSSKMYKTDYQETNAWGGEFKDIDDRKFKSLVSAHELGHAMGLDDDYMYEWGENFLLKEDGYFSQYYLGMPYHIDENSMMNTNKAPRLRHLWHVMNRTNEAATDNTKLKNLLNGTEYQLVNRYTKNGTAAVLRYRLKNNPNDYRDILRPFKEKRRLSTGTGVIDVGLYKLGEDELSRSIKIGPTPPGPVQRLFAFDGIQVVFIKLGFVFRNFTDNSDPANVINNNWTGVGKTNWMNNVKAEIKTLNNRFYLNGNNPDFKNTYLFFFPLCLEYKKIKADKGVAAEAATRAAAHCTIEVTFNNKKEAVARTTPLTTLRVGNSVSFKWIAKAVMGHDPGIVKGNTIASTDWSDPAAAQGKFTAANLEFLKTWINSADGLNGGAFEMKGS